MLLVTSESKQRSVFFDDRAIKLRWHKLILKHQGFPHSEGYIDQYDPVRVLGEGAFGTVHLARHKLSQVRVAIKAVSKAKLEATYAGNSERYDEASIMKLCYESRSQNIIEIVESLEDAENHYIVCEFWPGGDL